MDIYLTNNLTNKKEQFVPRDNKEVGMYAVSYTHLTLPTNREV